MKKNSTILVVDDTKENVDILLSLLQDYDVVVALNGEKALTMVDKYEIDLILLDIVMPGMDGFEVCKILKSQMHTKNIPVLFITVNDDNASVEKAFALGGLDYVTKPFKPTELLARVKTHVKLSHTLQSLEFLATRDSMTGIYNRRKFFELAKRLLKSGNNFFAIMIDIDNFKNINDTHGHPFGDVVIKSVVNTIVANIPRESIMGRLGGEEFCVLIKGDSKKAMLEKIEVVRLAVEHDTKTHNKMAINTSISSGIAYKTDHDTIDTLIKRADEALFMAKKTGRNKVCYEEV